MWWVFGKQQIWLLGGWLVDWRWVDWTGSTSRGNPSIPPSHHHLHITITGLWQLYNDKQRHLLKYVHLSNHPHQSLHRVRGFLAAQRHGGNPHIREIQILGLEANWHYSGRLRTKCPFWGISQETMTTFCQVRFVQGWWWRLWSSAPSRSSSSYLVERKMSKLS